MSEEKKPRALWRPLVGAALAFVTLLVLGYALDSARSRSDLVAALAELDAADPDWRAEELLEAGEIPQEQDSVPRLRSIAGTLPRQWLDAKLNTRLGSLKPGELPDAATLAAFDAALAPLAAQREEARTLDGWPRGRFVPTHATDPMGWRPPNPGPAAAVLKLLTADARRRAFAGQVDEALRSIRAGLNVTRSLENDLTLFAHRIRQDLFLTLLDSAEQVLAQGEPSDAGLARLQEELGREAASFSLAPGLRGERAVVHVLLTYSLTEWSDARLSSIPRVGVLGWVSAAWRQRAGRREHAAVLRLMTRMVEASELPAREQFAAVEEIQRRTRWRLSDVGANFLPRLSQPLAEARQAQCAAAAMRAAVAVERYRREHGRWPAALADVVPAFLKEVPEDPIDGAPVRYLRWADGVVVYSIGDDRKDDGGDVRRPRNDVGYRLWDVGKRRTPP